MAIVTMVVAIVLQLSVVAALDLPLGPPDIVLIMLACAALVEGRLFGVIVGFVVGLVADLLSTHVLGQTTMIFCLVGYGVGLASDEAERTAYLPLVVVAAASALGTAGHAAMAAILGDVSLTGTQALLRTVGAALYALVLTPLVFPLVGVGLRRLRGDRS
ncbi:rod shape-determining protein MreD [Frankia sp. Cppng1_Ct_nod]|uniref:rod shape-determining protein MreD n=1 Tax=Frankia sp. Cppng1_Ct_nod TaxID=2897162 RepID=UPI001F5EDEFD|nr:rod shape-determining protein MreD [Frankia sp. Cppng1_Ct_nod]